MNYFIGIPYVNRPDLLNIALNSFPQSAWSEKRILVLDNSDEPEASQIRYVPAVPLTFSQSMNFFLRHAIREKCDVFLFMHNDASTDSATIEKLLKLADTKRGHWGVIFTHYDALAAFNMEAMREVGEWDTNLPQYFADNDYYRRVRLAGWETEDTGLPVEHKASSTINADAERAFLNGVTFPLYEEYYKRKWGGKPGQECFITPFDRCQACG